MSESSTASELCRMSAVEAVERLARGEVSPLEMIDAVAARIEAVDGEINALPTLCLERARDRAKSLKRTNEEAPWLAGLPIPIKDLTDVAGVRTTYGSPIFAEHVPERSNILVERLEDRGALVFAKSNTPEFGAGSQTFNEVFGKTRNPWNLGRTVGGSSGGAAAALASGQAWVAHGSDMGGSLRNPASFCSVVGLRPTPGRVAEGPQLDPFQTLSVQGPMGRNAEDTALLLDAMSGRHPGHPRSLPPPAISFLEAARARTAPRRVAYSRDLGLVPVDKEVAEICEAAAHAFAETGAVVEDACPDFSEAMACFHTMRAVAFVTSRWHLLKAHRDRLKPEVIWNVEQGLKLTGGEIAEASLQRGRLYQSVAAFFERYDIFMCPAAIVPPFDVEQRYVAEIDGHKFDNYIDWMTVAYAVSLTGCPAVSAPAGFTRGGLPVGVQIVAPPQEEGRVLAAAALLGDINGIPARLPIDPLPAAADRAVA